MVIGEAFPAFFDFSDYMTCSSINIGLPYKFYNKEQDAKLVRNQDYNYISNTDLLTNKYNGGLRCVRLHQRE